MKSVVVYTVTGSDRHYKELCSNSINTLVKHGKYSGDILVLTDSLDGWDEFKNGFFDIKCVLNNRNHAVIQRCFLNELFDTEPYSHIMYLDCDILIMNEINVLFSNNNSILYAEEWFTIGGSRNDKNNTYFMSNSEIDLWKDKNTINAGQIVVPKCLFKPFFSKWKEIIGSHNEFGIDQSAFNYIIRKDYFCSENMNKYVCFSGEIQSKKNGVIINHWNCSHRSEKYKTVFKILENGMSLGGIDVPSNFIEKDSEPIDVEGKIFSFGERDCLPWGKLLFINGICYNRWHHNETTYLLKENILYLIDCFGNTTSVIKKIDNEYVGYNFEGKFLELKHVDQQLKIYSEHLDINVIDYCNFSCDNCNHFSSLYSKSDYLNIEKLRCDLNILSKLYHTKNALVIGGEPFLHPDLTNVLRIVKESNIGDNVHVYTNGSMLIERFDDEMVKYIDEIVISIYPDKISDLKIDAIKKFIDSKNIKYNIFNQKCFSKIFYKGERPIKDTCRIFLNCSFSNCHSYDNGIFFMCPSAYHLNKIKQTDVFDGINVSIANFEVLLSYLNRKDPLNACEHCNGSSCYVKWSESKICDWKIKNLS